MRIIKKRKFVFLPYILIVFLVSLFIWSSYIFTIKLRPRIITITQSYAKNVVSQVVDEEVKKIMLEELFSYDNLAVIKRDAQGRVTSISSNTITINRLANDLGMAIGDKLDEISVIKNKLYITSLVGLDLLSSVGPRVSVRFSPISVANADIFHSFEEAGINQTLHTVNLKVTVDMAIVMPLAHSTLTINSTMPLSQTLIVGSVPDAYLNKSISP